MGSLFLICLQSGGRHRRGPPLRGIPAQLLPRTPYRPQPRARLPRPRRRRIGSRPPRRDPWRKPWLTGRTECGRRSRYPHAAANHDFGLIGGARDPDRSATRFHGGSHARTAGTTAPLGLYLPSWPLEDHGGPPFSQRDHPDCLPAPPPSLLRAWTAAEEPGAWVGASKLGSSRIRYSQVVMPGPVRECCRRAPPGPLQLSVLAPWSLVAGGGPGSGSGYDGRQCLCP